MNEFYRSFVETAQSLATERGLQWALPCDGIGKVPKDQAWDLTALAGMVPPPFFRVTDLGFAAPGLARLNSMRERDGLPPLAIIALYSRSTVSLTRASLIPKLAARHAKSRKAKSGVALFLLKVEHSELDGRYPICPHPYSTGLRHVKDVAPRQAAVPDRKSVCAGAGGRGCAPPAGDTRRCRR